jgi:hypothetical protein
MPSLSHLTYCTPTKSIVYLANSLAAAISEPALYKLLAFEVPNLVSLFCCLGRTKVSVQVQCFVCKYFVTKIRFNSEDLLVPPPNPQAGRPPLVGCPQLLIQYIRSYPPYWRLFLQLQKVWIACDKVDVSKVTCGGHFNSKCKGLNKK